MYKVLLLGMCSIEGAEEATGTIAAETRELEAIEAVINGGHGTSMRPFVNWGWWAVEAAWADWAVKAVEAAEAVGAEEELAVSKTGNHVTMSGTVKSWGWSSFREDNFRIWEEFCGFSVSRDFPPADKTVRSVASELLKMKNKTKNK